MLSPELLSPELLAILEQGQRSADLFARHTIDRLCAICGATEFSIDVGETRFRTIEEATPHLLAAQHDQLVTQARLRAENN